MIDWSATTGAFLLSFLLVVPFVALLRARVLAFVAGATLVAVGALLLEVVGQSLVGPVNGAVFVTVLFAPLIEELLKLGLTGVTGRDARAAAGAGAGFAATENALYFLAAWGSGIPELAVLVAIRAITDPLLHTTTTTLATLTYRGRYWGLPSALLLHIGWNATTLALAGVDPVPGLLLLSAATFTVLGVAWWVHRAPSLQGALGPVPRGRLRWAAT